MERLDRIEQNLRRLAARDPRGRLAGAVGPRGHAHEQGPRLGEDDLRTLERRHGVMLPPAYRAFLHAVGDGGVGPDYGLLPAEEGLERAHAAMVEAGLEPSDPFPLASGDLEALGARDAAFIERGPLPGTLVLGELGGGWETHLVVTGPLSGTVWTFGDRGWRPSGGVGDGRRPVPADFLDWYEGWLDRSLRSPELADDPDEPPAPDTTVLNFSGLGLRALPGTVFAAPNLGELDVSDNEITDLDGSWAALPELTRLDARFNRLAGLPRSVRHWKRLERLDVRNNAIEELPDELGSLHDLTHLLLSGNRLRHLPDTVTSLRSLRILDLGLNPLEVLPADVGGLTALEALFLEGTALRRLPSTLPRLVALRRLRVRDSPDLEPTSALRTVCRLGALEHLQFAMVSLDQLPDEIVRLQNLETLEVQGNRLEAIPDAITRMWSLRTLVLRDNRLTSLPDDLGSFVGLRSLQLAGNPLDAGEVDRLRAELPGTTLDV